MFKRFLPNWLSERSTRDLNVNDPRTTALRANIITEKIFLRQIYEEWYRQIKQSIPEGAGRVLEIGSGGGFFKKVFPEGFTSEILLDQQCDIVLNGLQLPIANHSLRAITMINVLHHLPDPRKFFHEASRCVRKGGAIILVEPWVSKWSAFVYKHFHSEPFFPAAPEWEFESTGPLSGANEALPWMIFSRDRNKFELEFPEWTIQKISPMMPFLYLLSGGVSMKSLMPGWSYKTWQRIEKSLNPFIHSTAMFALIVLVKKEED